MNNPFAVSTWSLHRAMGYAYACGPADPAPFAKSLPWPPGGLDILDVPAALAAHGFSRCEICHFHLASLDAAYLAKVAQAFAAAKVTIQTLLIDDGDLSHPDPVIRARDLTWITDWLQAAAILKAEYARIIAGKQAPSPDALKSSVDGLNQLVALGRELGVTIVTENWLALTPSPNEVHHILDHVPGLGFLADTGNWSGASKFADLTSIFARASLCHAKATLAPGHIIDADDFGGCMQAAKDANFHGPMTLIFSDDGDEWQGLASERRFIEAT